MLREAWDANDSTETLVGEAAVEMRVTPGEGRPISFDFRMPESRYSAVEGDGGIERAEGRTLWTVPEKGGRFAYRYRIDRKRGGRGYDARITETWAILRGDQLVPPAFVRSTPYAAARATLPPWPPLRAAAPCPPSRCRHR